MQSKALKSLFGMFLSLILLSSPSSYALEPNLDKPLQSAKKEMALYDIVADGLTLEYDNNNCRMQLKNNSDVDLSGLHLKINLLTDDIISETSFATLEKFEPGIKATIEFSPKDKSFDTVSIKLSLPSSDIELDVIPIPITYTYNNTIIEYDDPEENQTKNPSPYPQESVSLRYAKSWAFENGYAEKGAKGVINYTIPIEITVGDRSDVQFVSFSSDDLPCWFATDIIDGNELHEYIFSFREDVDDIILEMIPAKFLEVDPSELGIQML